MKPQATDMIIDARIKVPWRDSASDPPVVPPPGFEKYDDLYGYGQLMNLTSEDLVTEMSSAGVGASFLMAEHEWGPDPEWNERCASLVAKHTDLFSCGFAAIDPRTGDDGVKELRRAYHELGLRGLVIEPDIHGLSPIDPVCRPLYKVCESLGIPVGIHTGINFTSTSPIGNGRPVLIDEIACAHPSLIIICHHGGWPWPLECIALAWKHPNVFIDYGAVSPRYMAKGGGYGDVVNLMNTVVRGQILFATDWPMIRYGRVLDEMVHLGLSDRTIEAYTKSNAQKILDRIA
jgi:predicted TIM-barrel fold metal-dependent hydrolase